MLSTKTSTFKTDANWTLPFPFFPSPFFLHLSSQKIKRISMAISNCFFSIVHPKNRWKHMSTFCVSGCVVPFFWTKSSWNQAPNYTLFFPKKLNDFCFLTISTYLVDHSLEIRALCFDEILHWIFFLNIVIVWNTKSQKSMIFISCFLIFLSMST